MALMPVMKGTTVTDQSAGPQPVTEPGGQATDEGMPNADRAAKLRAQLVEQLRTEGMIVTKAVEAAFQAVPRERFVPADVPLETAYAYDDAVVTKRDEHGVALSSVSAAYIQARMLEQAELRPGMTVLEVGSGGLNAALIAEIVGPDGRVVSVDIDPEVIDRAAKLLDEAGYGRRVRVVVADAEQGLPGEDQFDAIIVTVGAWDVSRALLAQLAAEGVLVLPLIMNGVTRVIGFRRTGDHLTGTSTEVAGFVPMQGAGARPEMVFPLADPNGKHVRLRFDTGVAADVSRLDGVLAAGRTEVWSGVTINHGVSFADLHLWFAWFLPGFCRFAADDGTDLADERGSWFPFGVVHGSAFAYLAVRPALDGAGVEFGARAYGSDGQLAATTMVEQIVAWNRHGRHASPMFAYWPTGGDRSQIPPDAAVMEKAHGVVQLLVNR
jgi:protein-L-isoaspartate(D-aspartate) O-methyltransferase